MANVASNSRLAAEQAERAAKEAAALARQAQYAAERARLIEGAYTIGADHYSGEYWGLKSRPVATLEGETPHGINSLHRLPNGDWMEVLSGVSWTRHTYDRAYALDRAKRAAIGGYAIRADLVALMVALVEAGANNMRIGALFQGIALDRPYLRAHGGADNLYASEKRASWQHYLSEECLALHPQHASLIRRTIDLLADPESIREFPAEIDPALSAVTRELTESLEAAS